MLLASSYNTKNKDINAKNRNINFADLHNNSSFDDNLVL